MKRAIFLASALVALGGTLAATSGCTATNTVRGWFMKGNILTYEQYLSVDQTSKPQPTADSVLQTLGMPAAVKDKDGVRREIDYHAYSLNGDLKTAEFHFDEQERLVKKELW